ncbi:Serine/threonine-protein phosphatase, partial [Phytophthora palmivora]
ERIGETNVGAMKSTLKSPQNRSPAKYRSSESGKVMPLVLRTEARRLSALNPTTTSRSTDENRDMNGTTNKEKIAMAHNRAILYDVFMEKYGSMRAVFRAFDKDGNGMISAQRFQDMVEAAEVDLKPDETRALYKAADINGDNTVAFQEFVQMFSPSASDVESLSAFSPLKGSGGLVQDPSSSMAIKYRSPLELSPRSRRRMKQLRKQVTDELRRKHGLAIGVHGGKPEELLTYAFKNVDSDNDGYLSYSEVEYALGRGYLQLESSIPASDMREMLQLMDRNSDEQISLREFVHYFAVGEREVPSDLIDNARKKELAALHFKRTVDLTPREEVDPIFAQMMNEASQQEDPPNTPVCKEISPGTCLPEQLNKRTAAIIIGGSDVGSPARNTKGAFAGKTSRLLSLQLEIDRRPASSCEAGSPVVAVLTPVSQDRFYHRRRERTDWSRVGVGGNGVGSNTGLYQSPQERFVTTSNEAYSPLYRASPSAKSDDVNDSFLIMRAGKPTPTVEEEARRARRTTRYEQTQSLLQQFEDEHAQAAQLKDWKSRANIRKVAGDRFRYLDKLQEQEHRIAARESHMQRRHGGANFLRMWAGSAESQFNDHQNPTS